MFKYNSAADRFFTYWMWVFQVHKIYCSYIYKHIPLCRTAHALIHKQAHTSIETKTNPKCETSEKNARKTIIITVTHKYTFLYGISTQQTERLYISNLCVHGCFSITLLFTSLAFFHSLLRTDKQTSRRKKNQKLEMKENDFT